MSTEENDITRDSIPRRRNLDHRENASSLQRTSDGDIVRNAAIWTTLVGSALCLAWSLLFGLDLSLWHDEVATVLHYISKGPQAIFVGADPNNHMLFSLVTWASTTLSATTEFAYRFWSVIPAAVAVGLAFFWLKAKTGIVTATAFLTLTAVNPLFISLVRQARGYGMTSLFVLMMIGAAWHATAPSSLPRTLWPVGIWATLAIFTLPQAALPFLALLLVLFPTHRWRVLALGGGVAGSSLLWYLGNLNGLIDRVGVGFGAPLPWYGFLNGPIKFTLFPITRLLRPGLVDPFRPPPDPRDLLVFATYALVALAFWLGIRRLSRVGSTWQAATVWAPLFGTFLAFEVSRVSLEYRFASFLILPATALAAIGAVAVMKSVAGWMHLRSARWVAGATCALFLIALSVPVYERLTSIPIEDFKDVAALVATTEGPVLTNTLRPPGLDYYIDKPLEIVPNDELGLATCQLAGTSFVVIDQPLLQEAPLDTTCLVDSDAQLVRFRQLIRGDRIDVWIARDDG
jgi:riboflavin transporter FmnP